MEQEDYLETIYNLAHEQSLVRISDVAKILKLSKPSVTQMMQRLEKEGCVVYKPYLPLQLTNKGKRIGKKVAERHKYLSEFFTILGIDHRTQEKDIHGIEHSLSEKTLKELKKVSDFLKKNRYKS
ncbi:MAG: iron dependent repressor, metal binding and dimerization domain protein [Patescibacteria group bacterium]